MADIQVKRKTSVTVTETFLYDGAPRDLDSGVPVVTATAPDGTTTIPAVSGTWTGRTTGQYRVVLSAQPEVTWRELAWVGTIGGEPQTLESRVEWLGSLLFTLSDLRGYTMPGSAATPFDDDVKYPDAKLHKARAATLARFTKALGFSPVPRHAREVHSVGYGGQVIVKELYPTRLLSVSVGGAAQLAAGYFIDSGGVVLPVANYSPGYWTAYGYGVVAIEYEHGWSGVDDDGRDAALAYAASKLNPSAFTSGTSYTTPDGVSVQYEPSETGRGGFRRFTDIRDVNKWLNLHAAGEVAVA
jgi:hypothetical protein